MFDMIESEVHGWYWKIELGCDCRFEWYHDKYMGIRMIYPPDDRLILSVIGLAHPVLEDGTDAIDKGIQQLSDAKAPIFKIRCPIHKTFEQLNKMNTDTHYSQWSGRHTSVPFYTTRHHGTFIGSERIS